MKKKRHLTYDERVVIYQMRMRNEGIRAIARATGRDPSVVSRELKRNGLPKKYASKAKLVSAVDRARYAQWKSEERLKERKRGIRKCHRWNWYGKRVVTLLVDERMSPQQIAQTLAKEGISISASTIYRMCTKDTVRLSQYLPRKGKSRRRGITRCRKRLPATSVPKRTIDDRPSQANKRQTLGHLEADTIHSKRGTKGGILSIIDRLSRLKTYIPLPDLTAESTKRALVGFLHTVPDSERKTLTLDNGSEFEQWDEIERIFPSLKVFFCEPYASYQKGSVERSNQDFRRFMPKGTDLSRYTTEDIKEVERKVNNFPIKLHGWKTPHEYLELTRSLSA